MFTCAPEMLCDVLEEVKPLLPDHYEELALNKEHIALEPAYETYLAIEKKGQLCFIALRQQGKLVGYFIGFVIRDLHYQSCLSCKMDIFFTDSSVRGQGAGTLLFNTAEKELRRRGVLRWIVVSKLHKDSGGFFEKLDFVPIEVCYSKLLRET